MPPAMFAQKKQFCIPKPFNPLPPPGAVLQGKKRKRGFITPTETHAHEDALYFMDLGKTQYHRKGIEQWLAAVGGWRLAVGSWWSLGAVLKGCP